MVVHDGRERIASLLACRYQDARALARDGRELSWGSDEGAFQFGGKLPAAYTADSSRF